MISLVKPYIAPAEEMMPAIQNILYSGYIAESEPVWDFEKQFGLFIDNKNTIVVNSGTAALHISLSILDIGPGDEVISTPMTSEPTNTTIALTGAKVVWGDVDPNTGLLDPRSVEEKINENTKAIMLVHYAGMVCDMNEFNMISKKYGIPIIEDAAHALGSRYKGKIIASNSRFTCFSFQAIKQMTTVDGGAIGFKNEDDVAVAKKLRWFGLDKSVSRMNNDITRAGYKYGMNNVTATIGQIQLKHTPEVLNKYIENGKYYDDKLKSVAGIHLVPYYEDTQPSYWLYTMKVENREDFCKMMEEKGIAASPLHHRSDTHSVFEESRCDLPNMDEWYSRFVHIPCGWWVGNEEREYIIDTIRKGW
ncbi:MAG: DegT/DnrJ/EryC1/StrS family aminotransferase [Paludibacteraceae bacterium]|nr:DegT/DnrJ/EryC1/StrS family aminotransferase [Paludibacteraceae bacterium]